MVVSSRAFIIEIAGENRTTPGARGHRGYDRGPPDYLSRTSSTCSSVWLSVVLQRRSQPPSPSPMPASPSRVFLVASTTGARLTPAKKFTGLRLQLPQPATLHRTDHLHLDRASVQIAETESADRLPMRNRQWSRPSTLRSTIRALPAASIGSPVDRRGQPGSGGFAGMRSSCSLCMVWICAIPPASV